MILSSETIREKLDKKELLIEPLDDENIQPASIDLRLGQHFQVLDEYTTSKISMKEEGSYQEIFIGEGDSIMIPAHSFMLATTKEWVRLSNKFTAFVEGRSSIGRLGLFVQNAGWVDPGFEGRITLELFNSNRFPIELIEGRRVCQLVIAEVDKPTTAYQGKYSKQQSTTTSAIHMDKENLNLK